jgi:hypothetical protein
MYIAAVPSSGVGAWLGQPTKSKPYKPPFSGGGEAVGEQHAQALLTVLGGPSPYQDYILPVMATQGSAVPTSFLRVVTSVRTQVPEHLRGLFQSSGGGLVGGTVDRWTRTVYVIQAPGLRNATRLEYALHECVHLLAHPVVPAQGSCPRICVGTFQRTYGTGFGEGGTQAITEAIMGAQGISVYYRDRPYEVFTPPVRELIKIFTVDLFARAYFWGAVAAFTQAMEARWGRGWMQVAGYTTTRQPKKALEEIKKLEAAHHQRRWQRGPAGDFPTPARTRRMA